MVLEEYREIVGTAASLVTMTQVFAPAFICKDIIKQGNTDKTTMGPFVGGLAMSLVILKYALILNDPAMIPANLVGLTLNLVYLSIFFIYTEQKTELAQNIIKTLIAVGVIYLYAMFENQERLEFVYGLFVTIMMLGLLSAPLLGLKEIIAKKDPSKLPFPMILCGTVVTSLWLLYGIIIKNYFMQIQNVVAFALCAFQLSLFVIYPAKKVEDKKTKSQ